MLLVLGVAGWATVLPSAPPARADTPTCTISAKLVNSCRPWFGAESGAYGGLSSSAFRARMLEHETRIGRPLDIVHAYTGVGAVLTNDIRTLAQRPATIALVNWRVSFNWALGDGRSATVNNQIDAMANSIKSLGTTRIMLSVYHEPEGSISAGGSPSCPTQNLNGTSGSTADYVNMWHNVRQRFDALGVSNVVWVMNYTGYVSGHCLTKDLWPGNDFVDWVMWDPYPKNASWTATVGSFYNYLTNNSDPDHDFLSKPWGLSEFGYVGSSQTAAYAMYDEARRNLQDGVHPRLKAYLVWDNYTSSSHDDRVGYTETHVADPVEQEHFNAFVNDPALMGTAVPEPTDLTAPTVEMSAPLDGADVSDTVAVAGTASDDTGVAGVDLLVDDDPVASVEPDSDGAVTLEWNSATLPNGTHTLRLRARDAAGNHGLSDAVSVTVENVDEERPTPPSGLVGEWRRPSQVALSWSAATDDRAVTGYRVYRDGGELTTLGPAAREFVDAGVANLNTHTYTVSALDAAGHESDQSDPAVVPAGDDTAPSTPTLGAVLTAEDAATLTWDASTDNGSVAGYRVYRDGSLLDDVSPATRTLVDGGLDNAVTYVYRVAAYDDSGNSSPLSEPDAVTTPDTTEPSAPAGLTAVSAPQSVALAWLAASDNVDVTDYVVYRDGLPVATLEATARWWTDTALVGTTLHHYQVTARDGSGNESAKSNEVARTVDSTAPTVPPNLVAVSSPTSVALSWGGSTDAVGVTSYVVYRDGLPVMTLGSTARSWTDTALVGTTLHRYRVTARDASGNESAKSNEVARTLVDTTAPSTPTRLAGSLSGLTVRLTWTGSTDNVGVASYTVYRAGVAIGTSTTPAYTDSTPPLGRSSSYTVRARDAAGNLSAASTAASVTVPTDKTAPTTPSGLRVTVGATGTRQLTIAWTASTDNVGVASYYLYRANAKYKLLGKVTSYVDTALRAGTKYTYKVYAIDGSGNWSGASVNVSGTAR